MSAGEPHPVLEAWERCWSLHPASIAAHWSRIASACTFVPYDAGSILHGRYAIVSHLARRVASARLLHAEWRVLAAWEQGPVQLVVAELDLVTGPPQGAAPERRSLRFLGAGERDGEHVRLRHASEAMPAVLVDAIGAYEQHARDGGGR